MQEIYYRRDRFWDLTIWRSLDRVCGSCTLVCFPSEGFLLSISIFETTVRFLQCPSPCREKKKTASTQPWTRLRATYSSQNLWEWNGRCQGHRAPWRFSVFLQASLTVRRKYSTCVLWIMITELHTTVAHYQRWHLWNVWSLFTDS
jgi:hypothetical protein